MTGKRKHYKFTKRKKSVRGSLALILAVGAILILAVTVMESFHKGGNGSVYLGSAGVLALLISVCALILAILAVKEEDTFKTVPYISLVCSVLITGVWAAIYAAGFLL